MSSTALKNLIQPHTQAVAAAIKTAGLPAEESDLLETLSIVVEQCPVAIAMFDRDMKYLLANRQWVHEFNLNRAMPLVGKCQYEVFPNLHNGWKEIYERALKGYSMRCEHPVQAQAGGAVIAVRSEVKPWRQKRDASVGGVVVMCHKMGGTPELAQDSAAAPISVSESAPEVRQEEDLDLSALPLPIYLVDSEGQILRANALARKQNLARGLVLGETALWEVLEGGKEGGTLQQSFLEKVSKLSGSADSIPQLLTLRQPSDLSETAGVTGLGRWPSRWLLTRSGEKPGLFAMVGLVGLSPFEALTNGKLALGVTAAPTHVVAPAKIFAEPPNPLAATEIKRLEQELASAREAVTRLEQQVRTMRQTEEVLIRREKQQQSVLDGLPGGVLVLNELGAPILQNAQLQRLFGRSIGEGERVEDWLGQACPDPLHREEVLQVWRQDIWRRQLTRTLSFVTTEGLLKEVELRPASLAENGLAVHFHDVTQLCRIEEQLCAMEGKFRTLFQGDPLPIILTDRTGAIYDVNLSAERLFQSSKQDLRRLLVDALLVEGSGAARRDLIREMRQSGATQQRLSVTLSGEVASEMQVTLVPIKMVDGEIHSLLHFFESPMAWPTEDRALPQTSIEQPTPVEETPLQPNAVDAGLAAASGCKPESVLLISTNMNGRIVRWTAEAEQRFGYAEAEALQQPLHLLFQPSDASDFYAKTLELAVAAKQVVWPFFGREGARGEVTCEVRAGEQGGAQVEVWECRPAVVADVLAAITTEAPPPEPEPLPETLPVRPAWGLADLSREQVIVSETYHRIQHHLSILSSLLNVQANTVTDSVAREALLASQNRLRAMAALHSHLEQVGKTQGDGFGGMVAGLIRHLRSCYAVSDTRVVVDLAMPPELSLPKEWLMPLTMSLNEALSNAFEHAFPDERAGQVTVALLRDGPQVSLEISDNGVGFTDSVEAMAERGMGLKILALFAEQMKGKLETVSDPGKGVKVRLQFFIAFADN